MYSPLRVSTRTESPSSMKSGTWTITPDSSVAGLLPPPEAVSPLRPGSVWVTFISIALGTCTSLGCSSTKRTSTSSLGSKGTLWHWQGAAGLVEALACLLCHEAGTLAPTHGAAPVDALWEDLDIVLEPRPMEAKASLSISGGLGGINTAAVLAA